jgi:hypothetical protein
MSSSFAALSQCTTAPKLQKVPASPLIEVLYFDGCPNHEEAVTLVKRVASELGFDPSIEITEVRDAEAARRHRFLGSPTVRVAGRDVDPGADERTDYVMACRIYQGERGPSGLPDEEWLRDALRESLAGS